MPPSNILSRVLKTVLATASVLAMSSALAQEALRIGAINPYSGPLALYCDECARGYQLAIAGVAMVNVPRQ